MIDSDAGVLMIMILPDAFAPPPSSCLAFSPVNMDLILVLVTNIIMVFNHSKYHLHHKVRLAWHQSHCIVIIFKMISVIISVIISVVISGIIIDMIGRQAMSHYCRVSVMFFARQ